MKSAKKVGKVSLIIILMIVVALLLIYVNHRIKLQRESKLLVPTGEMVQVDGHNMSVYVEGCGEKTLVFLSGGGTCSPILDFKSLYSLLREEYRIVVVEKFGYGFSDVVEKERDIASILEDTRAALAAAGVDGPYILCPHSMSGLEALYWTEQYPNEVSAIVGLDMAVPQAYADYHIHMPMLKVTQFAAKVGITRILPNVAESDAIKYGILSEEEKALYRAIFYRRTATATMMKEVEYVKENAQAVEAAGIPQVPMLLFVSNGMGTGWEEETWRQYQKDYIANVQNGSLVELNCPHYVHDYEYEQISEKIIEFVNSGEQL